jgi:uncharacterized protein (DUF362 family)
MNRRQFLQSSVLGLGALHSLTRLNASPIFSPETPYDLSIIKGGDISASVHSAVEALGGIKRFVKPGNIVFLKPNMSFPNPPEWGSTTHPDIISTVARMCVEAGAKRVIVSDFPMGRAQLCFEKSGMTALSAATKEFSFVELKEESQFEVVPVPNGEEVKELRIAKLVRKADVFINLPTAKAHSATGVSFGLKNLMGLFWERRAFHRQYNLHNAIADLASVLKPQLTILDGMYALTTNGPQGPGKTEQLNTIIAGIDPVAVDAAGCALTEWNSHATTPGSVQHIALAAKRGLGTADVSKLKVYRS